MAPLSWASLGQTYEADGLAESIRVGDPSVQRRRAWGDVDAVIVIDLSDSYAAVYGVPDAPSPYGTDFGCAGCEDGLCSELCCEQCDCSGDSSCPAGQWDCAYCGDSRFGRTDSRGCKTCNEAAERDDEEWVGMDADEAALTHPPLDSAITPDPADEDLTDMSYEEYLRTLGVRELHLDLSFGAHIYIQAYPDGSVTLEARPGSIGGHECSCVSISAKAAKKIRKFLKESR